MTSIWRKLAVCTGMLCVFLVFIVTDGGGDPVASGGRHSAVVKLGGQQVAECSKGPVYRRFTQMTVELEGVTTDEVGELLVVLKPLWRDPDTLRSSESLRSRFHPSGFRRARAILELESDEGPMAIGPYVATVYRWQQGGYQQIAEQPCFVIFNAFDRLDRASHHWRASNYLSDEMHITQKSKDGKPRLYDWQLDIERDSVFHLAIEAVAGSRHPGTAVEQVAWVTANKIEGYWPNLGVVGDRVPDGIQSERIQSDGIQKRDRAQGNDDSWEPASIRSISRRLRSGARRGQCFDYAAFSVALLRSVGLASTATTVLDPDRIDHPGSSNRQVSWSFHVWTEVFIDGQWKALDVAYLDPLLRHGVRWQVYPGLQPADGPWFVRMIGDESRVYRQRGRHVAEITNRY